MSHNDDQPGNIVKNEIHNEVRSGLKLFPFYVFSKILSIHVVVGFLTLLICPQFGVGPLGKESALSLFFMTYGPLACAFLCGGLFLGSSSLVLSIVLKPGELLYLNQHKFGIFSGLSLGSLFTFIIINQSYSLSSPMLSLDTALVWLCASIGFAFLCLYLGRQIYKRV